MGITQTLTSQGTDPHGALGWVAALIMPLFSDANCGDLAALLDLHPEDDVLDVACGAGVFLEKRASHVQHVAGLDHSDIQIRLARRRHRDRIAAGTAEIVRGEAEALPWEDGRFSAVACNCVACFRHPEQSLGEMYRVLRQGGRAAFGIDYCPDEQTARAKEQKWSLPYWTETEFANLLYETGFTEIATRRFKKLVFARAMKPLQH